MLPHTTSHWTYTTGIVLVTILAVIVFGILHLWTSNFTDFNRSAQSSQGTFYFDKKFVPIMDNISNVVPHNDTIVMPFNSTSLLDYFIQSDMEIPYGVYSLQSLQVYMTKNDRGWLLVYENVSHTKSLNQLFNKEGLKDLDSIFQRISEYSTEDQSKFHLYKLIEKSQN
jgi:hypothetical protein